MGCRWGWFVGLMLTTTVVAQEPSVPTAQGGILVGDRLVVDPEAYEALWQRRGPSSARGFVDVVAVPGGAEVVALDAEGGVWRWDEVSWIKVLDAPLDGLRLLDPVDPNLGLGDAQGNRENFDGAGDGGESRGDGENNVVIGATRPLNASLGLEREGRQRVVGRLAWLGSEGLAVLRPDGLYLSPDGGEVWERAVREPAFCIAEFQGRAWLGTPGGLWTRSESDGRWRPDRGLGADPVLDLLAVGDDLLALSGGSIQATRDGERWRVRQPSLDARALLAVSGQDRLWVAMEDTVLKARGLGRSLSAPVGTPPRDVWSMVGLDGGQLMVAGDRGAWLSSDGGDSWTPLSRGLRGAHARGVARTPAGQLWLASADGLYRLEEGTGFALGPPRTEPWLTVEELLVASAERVGVRNKRELSGTGRLILRYLMPRVRVQARWLDNANVSSRLGGGYVLQPDDVFQFYVDLTWVPPGARRRIETDDFSGDVRDTRSVRLDDSGNRALQQAAGDTLGQSWSSNIRQELDSFTRITALYREREDRLGELNTADGARSLHEEVRLVLDLEEIDAQLDALTDGAVSRYTAARAPNEEGTQ